MSCMKSREDVKKNSVTWRKNLTAQKSLTKRKILATVNNPLDGLTRMLKEMKIIGRF